MTNRFKSLVIAGVILCIALTKTQGQENLSLAGTQAWKLHIIDDGYSGADGVRLADVNDDGLQDIATGWEEEGFTKVYLHPGHQRVTEKWPGVIVGETPSVEDAVFMDLDHDGAPEVVSSTEGKSKRIFIHWSPQSQSDILDSAKWKTEVLPVSDGLMQWMYALPMQVDGKYGVDIVAGSKGEGARIGWFQSPENPRNLHEWQWHELTPCGWIMSLFVRDMDGDGDMDVVTSDRRGQQCSVRWLENPGSGEELFKAWRNHTIGAKNREVMFMDLADLDQDGLEDALVTEYTNQNIVFMKRLDKSGVNWEEHEFPLPPFSGRAKSIRVGDMNGDEKPDIVHSANTLGDSIRHGLLWLSSVAPGHNSKWQQVSGTTGYKFDRIELLDIDGDGDLDVLTCEENFGRDSKGLGVIWYENPVK